MINSYSARRLFSDSMPHIDASEDIFSLLNVPSRIFAIFSTSPDGKITSWSKGAEKLFKVSRIDMVGKSSSVLFSNDSWLSFLEMISKPEKLAIGGEIKQFFFKITELDSTQLHVAVSRSTNDSSDEITMVLVVEGDSEPELGFQDMAEILFRSHQCCAKLLDINGKVLALNPMGRSLLEVEDFSIFEGQNWIDLWAPEHKAKAQKAVSQAAAGNPSTFEGACPTLKGNLHNWKVEVHPVKNRLGKVIQILTISTPQ